MSVKIIVGAEAAYACATWNGGSLDVKLPAGKSAVAGLRDLANVEFDRAVAMTVRANRMMAMADELEHNNG